MSKSLIALPELVTQRTSVCSISVFSNENSSLICRTFKWSGNYKGQHWGGTAVRLPPCLLCWNYFVKLWVRLVSVPLCFSPLPALRPSELAPRQWYVLAPNATSSSVLLRFSTGANEELHIHLFHVPHKNHHLVQKRHLRFCGVETWTLTSSFALSLHFQQWSVALWGRVLSFCLLIFQLFISISIWFFYCVCASFCKWKRTELGQFAFQSFTEKAQTKWYLLSQYSRLTRSIALCLHLMWTSSSWSVCFSRTQL